VETPDELVRLTYKVSPALGDHLTLHIATCHDCKMGAPPRSLCAAAQRLIIDSITIEVADGSDSD